ncbi:hypothetical protein HCC61_14445 [Streptomyces sp. HNM0575]|uniref:HAD family acid phosphatase n=1 Tax=Streptomyces sp. HNM0575 TaxID=2716338 RepID=UPI00145EF4C0|nr:HAD family acid phosphatase [Streptomyces sp. HNM0575]NLU73864.1 hypothetical protein [Streptomyces sp. HNM0575]
MHGRKWTTRIAVSVAGATAATVTVVGVPAIATPSEPAAAAGKSAPTADEQPAHGTSAAAPAEREAASKADSKADSEAAPKVASRHSADRHGVLADVDYDTWKRDVSAVTDKARPYLEKRISQGSGEKMAVVFDIDNTVLETAFHPIWELPTPAVQQTLDLARYADSRGVAVYFVTARPGIISSLTKDNLEKDGFPISGLYVRDLPDIFEEVAKYKTAKRAEIEDEGYKIIANIGNSPTDMVGGHAEETFKLPDYDGKLD